VNPFGAFCGATVTQHGVTIDLLDRRFEQQEVVQTEAGCLVCV